MAPLTTHVVIGERVFGPSRQFDRADYGAFLLGCVLVDVNGPVASFAVKGENGTVVDAFQLKAR